MSFDFLTSSLTARLIKKIYANIIKVKLFLKVFLLVNQVEKIFCTIFWIRQVVKFEFEFKKSQMNYKSERSEYILTTGG
jgi:hypothetical protein